MTPATHAAVAAVAACRFRSLPVALAAAFALHFAADFFYHFEAFYPLSVLGPWPEGAAMAGLFVVLAGVAAPVVYWIARKDRTTGLFSVYALLLCALPLDRNVARRVVAAALLSIVWIVLARTGELRRWVLCSFAAYLPDVARHFLVPLDRVHGLAHYDPTLDLGHWVSLLVRGRWQIPINDRIFDPCYLAGYALEVLLEAGILFWCLWWLARRRSVANLPAVDHQRNPVDEGSLVG